MGVAWCAGACRCVGPLACHAMGRMALPRGSAGEEGMRKDERREAAREVSSSA